MDNIFYIYAYLNPLKKYNKEHCGYFFEYEPFYIGKGKGDRLLSHLKEAVMLTTIKKSSSYKVNKIKSIIQQTGKDPIIVKIKTNLNEKQSFYYEKKYIKLIGRFNINTGPLTNMTEGGVGGNTLQFHPDKKRIINECIKNGQLTRSKWSVERKIQFSEIVRKRMKGTHLSVETKNKLKQYKGNKHSQFIHVNQNVIKQIIHLYIGQQMYMKDISNVFNLNENKIKNILVSSGIKIRKKEPVNKIKLKDDMIKHIIELYEVERLSINKISTHLNIQSSAVYRILRENNVNFRDNTGPQSKEHIKKLSIAKKGKYVAENNSNFIPVTIEQQNKIIELRSSGMSVEKIGVELGFKYGKLYNYMKRKGML